MRRTRFPQKKEDLSQEGRKVLQWIYENEPRFESVKEATRAYLEHHGRVIPPEFEDFVDYMIAIKRDPEERITDVDFLNYHKWRQQEYRAPSEQKSKLSTRVCALIMVVAYHKGEITQETKDSKKAIIELSENLFPYGGKKIYEHFRELKLLREDELPELSEFDIATSLFPEYFPES